MPLLQWGSPVKKHKAFFITQKFHTYAHKHTQFPLQVSVHMQQEEQTQWFLQIHSDGFGLVIGFGEPPDSLFFKQTKVNSDYLV